MRPALVVLFLLALFSVYALPASAACSDTDGGNDPYVKGTAAWPEDPITRGAPQTDYCDGEEGGLEYYCAGGELMNDAFMCPPHFLCSDGACTLPCTDSDKGNDITVKGTARAPRDVPSGGAPQTDYCDGEEGGLEYYCSGDNLVSSPFACPADFTCSDGACVRAGTETDCPECTELAGRPRAQMTSLVDVDARTVEFIGYYENLTLSPSRRPLNNTVLILEVTPKTKATRLYRIYTDAAGKARYNFQDLSDECIQFKAVYCPFCIPETTECGFEACMNFARITTTAKKVSDIPNAPDASQPAALNGEKYLPNVATAAYCPPPPTGAETPALCLPLIIVFSLLSGALYATGRNPFAGFDFSGARMSGVPSRYQARGRGVAVSTTALASAVSSVAGAVKGAKKAGKDAVKKAEAKAAKENKTLSAAEKKQIARDARRDYHRDAFRQAGRLNSPFAGIRQIRGAVSSLRSARATAPQRKQGEKLLPYLQRRASALSEGFGSGMQNRGLGGSSMNLQMLGGGKFAPTAAGGTGRGAIGGSWGSTVLGALGTIGITALMRSPIGVFLEMGNSLFCPTSKFMSLTERLSNLQGGGTTASERAKMDAANKALEEKKTEDGKGIKTVLVTPEIQLPSMVKGGETLPGKALGNVEVRSREEIDQKTGRTVTVVSYSLPPEGGNLGKVGKLEIVGAEARMVTGPDGKSRIVSVDLLLAQPGAKGEPTLRMSSAAPLVTDPVTGAVGWQLDKKGVPVLEPPKLFTPEGKQLAALPDGSKLDVKDFTKSAKIFEATNDSVRNELSSLNSARAAAMDALRPRLDGDLNKEIKKSPEMQKQVEESRSSYAEGALAAAGLRTPETLEKVPGIAPKEQQTTETAAAIKISNAWGETGFASTMVYELDEKGKPAKYKGGEAGVPLSMDGMPKPAVGYNTVGMSGTLAQDLGFKPNSQNAEAFTAAVQHLVLNSTLNDLKNAGGDREQMKAGLERSLIATGVDPAAAHSMVHGGTVTRPDGSRADVPPLSNAGLDRMAARVSGEATTLLADFRKQGFAEGYIRNELGNASISGLGQLSAAGVGLTMSYENPAAALSLPTSSIDNLKMQGKAGDLLREREMLLAAQQHAQAPAAFTGSTEAFFRQNDRVAQNVTDYMTVLASNETLNNGRLKKEAEADPSGAAAFQATRDYAVNAAIAARGDSNLEALRQGVGSLPADAIRLANQEGSWQESVKQCVLDGNYPAAIATAQAYAQEHRNNGNPAAAHAYEMLANNLQKAADAPADARLEIANAALTHLPTPSGFEGVGSLPNAAVAAQITRDETSFREDLRQKLEKGDYKGAAAAAEQRASYYSEQGNGTASAAYSQLASNISYVSAAPSDEYKLNAHPKLAEQVAALPEPAAIAQVSSMQERTLLVQERLSNALNAAQENVGWQEAIRMCVAEGNYEAAAATAKEYAKQHADAGNIGAAHAYESLANNLAWQESVKQYVAEGDYKAAIATSQAYAEQQRKEGHPAAARTYDDLANGLQKASAAPPEQRQSIASTTLETATASSFQQAPPPSAPDNPASSSLRTAENLLAEEYRFRLAAGDQQGAKLCMDGMRQITDLRHGEFEGAPMPPISTQQGQTAYQAAVEGIAVSAGKVIDPALAGNVFHSVDEAHINAAGAYKVAVESGSEFIAKKLKAAGGPGGEGGGEAATPPPEEPKQSKTEKVPKNVDIVTPPKTDEGFA